MYLEKKYKRLTTKAVLIIFTTARQLVNNSFVYINRLQYDTSVRDKQGILVKSLINSFLVSFYLLLSVFRTYLKDYLEVSL